MANIIESFRGNLRANLPLLVIAMLFFGCMMFSVVAVIPQWRTHEDFSGQLNDDQQAIAATVTAQSQSNDASFLQRQIENAQLMLSQSGDVFLTQAQVDNLLKKIYDYADTSGAKISNLQEQASDPNAAAGAPKASAPAYDTRIFHLQVNGGVIPLMNFVVLIREASLRGVVISDLKLARSDAPGALTMTLTVYTSSFATGKNYDGLAGKATPVMIAIVPTVTPSPTPSPIPPATVVSTIPTLVASAIPVTDSVTSAAPTLVGQCTQHNTATMGELKFSQIQQSSGTCDNQIWTFKLDKQTAFVMDIVRHSGSGAFRMELHDSSDKVLGATLSSVDGRGILVANSAAGSYTLNIIPLAATGTWVYSLAIWPGLPALSFSYAQNSYSSHTGIGTQSNTMTWSYSLTGGSQAYHIQSTRTDGNLEYDVIVFDSTQKQVAEAKSSGGNVTVDLTTGPGVYTVRLVTVEGTSGSYRIGLIH